MYLTKIGTRPIASVVVIFHILPKMEVDYGQWQATGCVEHEEDFF